MLIHFFANEDSLKNVPLNTKLIITEEDLEIVMEERNVFEISTTCTMVFNKLEKGDYLTVYDKSGQFDIKFDGETYTTIPKRTEKELRKEHNMEKLWRSGAFTMEVKNNEN